VTPEVAGLLTSEREYLACPDNVWLSYCPIVRLPQPRSGVQGVKLHRTGEDGNEWTTATADPRRGKIKAACIIENHA
jgi:hypothetical protein